MSEKKYKRVVVKSEDEALWEEIGSALGIPLIVAGLGAAISFKVFGTSLSGWIGAGVGLGVTMLNSEIRNDFLSMMFKIIFGVLSFAILAGAVIFIFTTFFSDENGVESKQNVITNKLSSVLKKSSNNNKKMTNSLKGTQQKKPTKEEILKRQCNSCSSIAEDKSQHPEYIRKSLEYCAPILDKCRRYNITW